VIEVEKGSGSEASARLQRINDALMQAERALLDDRGLHGRTWFKHQIYPPGFYT
jgi:N-acetylated-alpha-linked acidic dipeptidase